MNSYIHHSLVFLAIQYLCTFALSYQTESFGNSKFSRYSSKAQVSTHSNESQLVFNVLSYGAVGDGRSNDTDAFRKCWDAACHADTDSAVFLVPKNHNFTIQYLRFSGPCTSRQLFFQIQGRLVAPAGPARWVAVKRLYWLVFEGIDGLTVEGEGLVIGRGRGWWILPCKPHKGPNGTTLSGRCDSPIAMLFISCSNLTVQKFKVKSSPFFHFWFESCTDVLIDYMYIKSPASSPNTDGIHLHNSNRVKIHNSVIANGDDCVSIGGGSHNVDIKNLTCGPGHGISIGSLGMKNKRECVSNITVTNSTIKHSDNGLRIKTWQGGSGSVSGVTYDDIHMESVRNPIIISQYYCDKSYKCPNQTSAVHISGISYTNIRGTYNATRPPVYLACSDSAPCTNLTFRHVKLRPDRLQKKVSPFCWKASGEANDTTPSIDCLVKDQLPLPAVDKC